jgi:uncharacterized protein DUF5906
MSTATKPAPGTLPDDLNFRCLFKTMLSKPCWKISGSYPHPTDETMLIVPSEFGKHGFVGVRDAKVWGHQPTLVNLKDHEDFDACVSALVAHVPPDEVIRHCKRCDAGAVTARNIVQQLMLSQGAPFEDADEKWIDPLKYKEQIAPKDWARPNMVLIGGFPSVSTAEAKMFYRYNERYAVIDADGKVMVRDLESRVTYDSDNFFKHNKDTIQIVTKDAKGDTHVKTIKCAKHWFDSLFRTTYKGRNLFPLDKNARGQDYRQDPKTRNNWNTWEGFGVAPKKGDCRRFKEHLLSVVCRGNRWHYRYLWRWLAHRVQKPWQKPRVAIVLWSKEKQTGKSLVGEIFRDVIGEAHSTCINKDGQVVGRFANVHDCVFVQSEEALFSGNHQTVNITKDLITNSTQSVEIKNGATVKVPSYVGFMFTSNSDKAVHVTHDEERFLVLQVSAHKKGDKPYFQAILDQMGKHGGNEALMYELQRADLTRFAPNVVPKAHALGEMALAHLPALHRAIVDAIKEGAITARADGVTDLIPWHVDRPLHVESETLWKAWNKEAKGYGDAHGSKVAIGDALHELGLVVRKLRTDARVGQKAGYVLKSLPDARQTLAEHFNVPATLLGAVVGQEAVTEVEALHAMNLEALETLQANLRLALDDPALLAMKARIRHANHANHTPV